MQGNSAAVNQLKVFKSVLSVGFWAGWEQFGCTQTFILNDLLEFLSLIHLSPVLRSFLFTHTIIPFPSYHSLTKGKDHLTCRQYFLQTLCQYSFPRQISP